MYPNQNPAQPGVTSEPLVGGPTPFDPTMQSAAVPSPTIITPDTAAQPVQSTTPYDQPMSTDGFTQSAASQQPLYQQPQYQAAMPAFMQESAVQPQAVQSQYDPLMQQTAPLSPLDPLADVTMGENPSKSYVVALLLSYFVGVFGADRFYLGRKRTAIAKLLTLGGLGIWSLVDFLLVGLGRLRAADDPRPLEGFAKEAYWAKMVVMVLTVISVVAIVGFLILVMIMTADSL